MLKSPKNSFAENIIQCSLNDLFEYAQNQIRNSLNSKSYYFIILCIMGKKILNFFGNTRDSLLSNLNDHIVEIENQIDLRYESLVESLEMNRTECKIKLNIFRDDMEK